MSRDIFINLIDRDEAQPRQHFDQAALDELAQSISANGLAVPILVRPAGERFVIVHGERRYRAVCSLKWETIPAEVRDLSADEAGWLALVENVQRANLSPIEEARAYQARLAGGVTQEALGQRIGKTQSYIATKLRFLKLPVEAQQALDQRQISEGHAKQLLRIDDPKGILALLDDILRDRHSVHSVAGMVDHYCELRDTEKRFLKSLCAMGETLREIKHRLPGELWEPYLQSKDVRDVLACEISDMIIALVDNPPQRMGDVPLPVCEFFLRRFETQMASMSRDIAVEAQS